MVAPTPQGGVAGAELKLSATTRHRAKNRYASMLIQHLNFGAMPQ